MAEKTGIGPKVNHEIVGIKPSEKLHEEMITVNDALNTVEFCDYFTITTLLLFIIGLGKPQMKARVRRVNTVENLGFNSR